MSTLIVSDTSYTPEDQESILLTTENVDQHSTLPNKTYHTTLGDVSSETIIALLPYITQIKFVPDQFDVNSDLYKETMVLLNFLSHQVTVENLPVYKPQDFVNREEIFTRPETPVLWVFGCSHSVGVGLRPEEKKYSEIIGEKLKLPLKLIAQGGSSAQWSFRHLINADIRPDDVVIWQLTTPGRLTRVDETGLTEIQLAKTKDRYLLEVFNDQQIFFQHITILNIGVKYLRSKKVKFVLTSLLSENPLFYEYLLEFTKYPEYCYTPKFDIDLGTDQIHVGPNSHKKLAQLLLNHLQL